MLPLLERSLTWILKGLDTKGMFSSAMTLNFLQILFLIMKVNIPIWQNKNLTLTICYTSLFPTNGTLAWKYLMNLLPTLADGEVDSFRLIPVPHAANIIRRTHFFKPNCNLVIIDFLFRHGYHVHIIFFFCSSQPKNVIPCSIINKSFSHAVLIISPLGI